MALTLPSYNVNPTPQQGSGAYGLVPGSIAIPPSTYEQVGSVYPNLGGLTTGAGNTIQNELSGQLSSGTIGQLQDAAATQGQTSGMPGSGLASNNYLKSLGLTSEALTQKGVGDYLSFLTGVGSTQTSQTTAADIANTNAINAAAPNPTQAAQAEQSLFQQYLNAMTGANSGGSGFNFNPSGSGAGMSLFNNAGTSSMNNYANLVNSSYGGSSSPYNYYST